MEVCLKTEHQKQQRRLCWAAFGLFTADFVIDTKTNIEDKFPPLFPEMCARHSLTPSSPRVQKRRCSGVDGGKK